MPLKTKDRLLLLLGLFALGYSFFTIRFHYQLLPLEIAFIVAGVLLFGFSYWAIRKWKDKTTGITFQPDRSADSHFLLNAQALIVTSQIPAKGMPVSEDKMPFMAVVVSVAVVPEVIINILSFIYINLK